MSHAVSCYAYVLEAAGSAKCIGAAYQVSDLILVAAQSVKARLGSNIPYYDVCVLCARGQQTSLLVVLESCDLTLVPIQRDITGA